MILCLCSSLVSVSAANPPPSDVDVSDSELEVFDKDQTWNTKTQIDLFKRNELGNQLVYPGVTGEYSFTVNNKSLHGREAEVVISDTNDFDIPLDIRMTRDGSYVLGSEDTWVNSADYDSGIYTIDSSGTSVYKLEWKWDYYIGEDEDSRDTSLGVAAHYDKLPYNLDIVVYGEQDVIERSEPEPSPEPSPEPTPESKPDMPSNPEHSVPDSPDTVLTGDHVRPFIIGLSVCTVISLLVVCLANGKRGRGSDDDA